MDDIYQNLIDKIENLGNIKIVNQITNYNTIFFSNPFKYKKTFKFLNDVLTNEGKPSFNVLEHYPLGSLHLYGSEENKNITFFPLKDQYYSFLNSIKKQYNDLNKVLASLDNLTSFGKIKLGDLKLKIKKNTFDLIKDEVKKGASLLTHIEGTYQKTNMALLKLIDEEGLGGK